MPLTLRDLHPWDVTPDEAIRLQLSLADQVITDQPLETIRWVAGVDVDVKNAISRAAVVVLRYPELDVIETVTAERPTTFPYIPGLLSFREGAVILDALRQLQKTPDVFMFDGNGTIHPRRIGIASHLGLFLDRPTIGCGKTWMMGEYAPVPPEKGGWSPLYDRGEIIGTVLRTRADAQPVYISAGHRATQDTARELALRCTTSYRQPEPIRAAHHAAGAGRGD
jgi:deoxyribonuclease V